MSETDATPTPPLPAGEYAIVELMGHSTLIGRVEEVDRFGTKMLQIEPLFAGQLLGPVLQGGSAIYRFTPCTAEVAATRSPKHAYQLPGAILATVPPAILPAPSPLHDEYVEDPDADEEGPF